MCLLECALWFYRGKVSSSLLIAGKLPFIAESYPMHLNIMPMHTYIRSLSHPFEERMKSLQFAHLRKLNRPKKKRVLSDNTTQQLDQVSPRDDKILVSDTTREAGITLPPLVSKVKVQGPFRQPPEVWRQRHKPLSPTLRVATSYNSVEMAR
jgi:hypothetical protein